MTTNPLLTARVDDLIRRRLAEGQPANRLIGEKSPYLLQHAFNPVDWFPWGEEAFERARQDDKPIFLSIGYSTCYWCHVMEREVFEDPAIAALMNRTVVNIKVDREERPDVDRVYMAALMGLTGSGGWPMSMFLTPDLKPFFGATYLPPTPQHGRDSFPDLLKKIDELWSTDRRAILDAGDRLAGFLRETAEVSPMTAVPDVSIIGRACDAIGRSHDAQYGGFGGAPKFPTPVILDLLLRCHQTMQRSGALVMALRTMDRMLAGGIADHLGGGFHRYATDATWHVPHFEKMLYDQAQMAIVYLEAFQITGDERYRRTVEETLEYVGRDLTEVSGGFLSAEDAESAFDAATPDEKREGGFYTWTRSEVDAVMHADEANVFSFVFDVRQEGNVSADPHGVFRGTNILHRVHSTTEAARHFELTEEEVERRLASARRTLATERNRRPRPGLDDKVLTSWNGLMISAFARAYHVLRDPDLRGRAERAASFVLRALIDPRTGALRRRYRDGEARFDALLEDHAYLIQGLLDLYEASFDLRWLRTAIDLTERQIDLFYDEREGGFYDDQAGILADLVRTKEWHDGATPSANAVAAMNLMRLSAMLHDERYREIADRSLRLFGSWMERAPQGTGQWLSALAFRHANLRQVIVAGPPDHPQTQPLLAVIQRRFDPHRVVLLADGGTGQRFLKERHPMFETYVMVEDRPTVYVCRNFACQSPTSDPDLLAQLLDGEGAP